jgi:hypothetical protein
MLRQENEMRVRIEVDMSGTRNGIPWPSRGRIVDLPDDEARDMLHNGMVSVVSDEDREERAVLVPADMEDATGRHAHSDRNETKGDDPKASGDDDDDDDGTSPVTTKTAPALTRTAPTTAAPKTTPKK